MTTGDPGFSPLNTVISNDDDHSGNHAFLMDAGGDWMLSQVYDMSRSGYALGSGYRAAGVLEKFANIGTNKLREFGKQHGLRKVEDLISGVLDRGRRWPEFAERAGFSEAEGRLLRDEFPSSRW